MNWNQLLDPPDPLLLVASFLMFSLIFATCLLPVFFRNRRRRRRLFPQRWYWLPVLFLNRLNVHVSLSSRNLSPSLIFHSVKITGMGLAGLAIGCGIAGHLVAAGQHFPGGEVQTGKVIAIADGDTLTLLVDERSTRRIRLAGIDAPEKGQPFAEASRRSLAELVFGKTVEANCPGRDRYGRLICTVYCRGQEVNRIQVERGFAWAFRRYLPPPEYLRLEEQARRARRGLWQDPYPVPPWEWRRSGTALQN